jgi:hypothetical protein
MTHGATTGPADAVKECAVALVDGPCDDLDIVSESAAKI